MKKLLALCVFCVLFWSFNISAYAAVKGNVYVVKNATPAQVAKEISNSIKSDAVMFDEKNNVVVVDGENYCYFKSYKNDNNTELYVTSSKKQEKEIAALVEGLSFKTFSLDDKSTNKKYTSDFVSYSKANNLNAAVNLKVKEDKSVKGYDPYMGTLRNKKLETLKMNSNNIEIVRTKMEPKVKVKRAMYAYEYLITNNTDKDIVIKKVASAEFIGLTQSAAYALRPAPMDFVPVWGIVYGAQTDIEKNKFTRPHPSDETIAKGETMRVLALSKLEEDPVADFIFDISNKEVKMTFDPKKAEKL